MQFTISSSAFSSMLKVASKAIASKNTMPVLDCFLIEIGDSSIHITGSSEFRSIKMKMPIIDYTSEARICVDSKRMLEVLANIPEQPLVLEYNENTHELNGKHSAGKFSVMCQESEVYPTFAQVEDGQVFTISSKDLLSGLNVCQFVALVDDPVIWRNVIYFDIKEDNLTIAVTDGRKLVKKVYDNIKLGFNGGLPMPKTVAIILKNALKRDTDVTITYNKERAKIEFEDTEILFRMPEAKYPNYNCVIPANRPISATLDRLSIIGALKRVGVFSNKSNDMVMLELKDKQVFISGRDTDYNTSAEEHFVCDYDGEPFQIGFSHQFGLEMFSNMACEHVRVELCESNKPLVFIPDEENADILMLLMPILITQ